MCILFFSNVASPFNVNSFVFVQDKVPEFISGTETRTVLSPDSHAATIFLYSPSRKFPVATARDLLPVMEESISSGFLTSVESTPPGRVKSRS